MRVFHSPVVPTFFIILFVLLGVSKVNLNALIDHFRQQKYAHAIHEEMTVGVVWVPTQSKFDQRYSFYAGAQYALKTHLQQGSLKGVCRNIRLEMISEPTEQGDLMDKPLTKALRNPNLAALLGFTFSVDAHRAAILTAKRDVLLFTPSATWPPLTKHGFTNLFRLVPDDGDSARLLARYIKARGYTKVGIIYSMVLHGNAIAPLLVEELAKQGVTVAFSHAYPPNSNPTFPDAVNIIGPLLQRNHDIDALFMIDDLNVSARMLKYLRKAGVKQPIIGSDSLNIPSIWQDAGTAAEGISFVAPLVDEGMRTHITELYQTVVTAQDKQSVAMDDFMQFGFLEGYETMSLYLSAVEQAGSFYPQQLGIILRNQSWNTLHGQVTFSEDGDIIGRKLTVCTIRGGHPHVVFSDVCGEDDHTTVR